MMGSADVVPGVSGGTVALVLGIYERLLHNVRMGAAVLGWTGRGHFTKAGGELRQIDWGFIVPLLIGIGVAVLTLAQILDNLLDDHPQVMAALFFGLVAGSIYVASRLVTRWDNTRYLIMAGVTVAAFALLGLRWDEVASPSGLMFLGAGVLAIVAMILPGVSGSFILLMVGMYQPVLDAVNDREFAAMAMFALGAIVGLAGFSTVLDRVLRSHRDSVMAGLIGLMLGSLRVLWPWPEGTDTAELAAPIGGEWVGPLFLALAGGFAVLVIGTLATPSLPSPGGTTPSEAWGDGGPRDGGGGHAA